MSPEIKSILTQHYLDATNVHEFRFFPPGGCATRAERDRSIHQQIDRLKYTYPSLEATTFVGGTQAVQLNHPHHVAALSYKRNVHRHLASVLAARLLIAPAAREALASADRFVSPSQIAGPNYIMALLLEQNLERSCAITELTIRQTLEELQGFLQGLDFLAHRFRSKHLGDVAPAYVRPSTVHSCAHMSPILVIEYSL